MADRMTIWLGAAFMLLVGTTQVASCIFDCDEPAPLASGEYVIRNLSGPLEPGFEDLNGAQLIVDRDTETTTIRYNRDGTTYQVTHSLTDP